MADNTFVKDIKGALEALTITYWCWSLGVLLLWGYSSWCNEHHKLVDIPMSVVAMTGMSTVGSLISKLLDTRAQQQQ